jgi:hypothetical protein
MAGDRSTLIAAGLLRQILFNRPESIAHSAVASAMGQAIYVSIYS